MRKPFYKSSHSCWYYKDERGKDVRLDPDEETAHDLWREIAQGVRQVGRDARARDLILRFLDWSEANQSEGTYEFYRTYLESFRQSIGTLRVAALKPYHVTDWLAEKYPVRKSADHPNGTSDNTIHGAMRAVQRAFNWSKKQGLITSNPLADLEKPAPQPREVELSAEQFQAALNAVTDPTFKDFLIILRETGCRPLEARTVENRFFDRRAKRWVFPATKSKGKKRSRVVLLNDKAYRLAKKYADKYPTGPIFRKKNGKAWTKSALTQRCERLSEKAGFTIRPYSIRHHFVDEALGNHADPVALSIVLGHATPKMVTEVYQNIRKRDSHLEETLKRATRTTASAAAARAAQRHSRTIQNRLKNGPSRKP